MISVKDREIKRINGQYQHAEKLIIRYHEQEEKYIHELKKQQETINKHNREMQDLNDRYLEALKESSKKENEELIKNINQSELQQKQKEEINILKNKLNSLLEQVPLMRNEIEKHNREEGHKQYIINNLQTELNLFKETCFDTIFEECQTDSDLDCIEDKKSFILTWVKDMGRNR
eukprot:UN22719